MKRIISTMLTVLMLVSILPFCVSAKVYTGSCGANAKWSFDGDADVLTITGTGAIYNYSSEEKTPWHEYRQYITYVKIESGITRVGDRAFKLCRNLKDVDLPNTLKSIGEESFRQTALVSVELPDSVTEIGYMSFRECESLLHFNTGDGLKQIPGLGFFQCKSLKNLVIGKSVTDIASEAFNMCDSLEILTLGPNVQTVSDYAIFTCTSLKKIIVPKSLKKLGSISGCPKFKSIYYLGSKDDWAKIDTASGFDSISKAYNSHNHNTSTTRKVLVNGTCTGTQKRVELLKCNVCGADIDLTVRKITHKYGKFKYNNNATCYKNGTETALCIYCSDKKTRTVNNTKLTHSFGAYKYNNDATCTENGTETAVCRYCSLKNTRTAKNTKRGHNTKHFAAKPATYIDEGNIGYYYCSRCKCYFTDAKCTKKIAKSSITTARLYLPFTDVARNSWYYDAVCYCTTKGFVAGIDAVTFAPDNALTREQFIQILFNFAGEKASNWKGNVGYSDVPSGKWYSPAIKWAKKNEVTHGMGPDYFGLGIKIPREQFAYLLMNYAAYLGRDVSTRGSITKFSDKDKISLWAVEPVKWAVGEELIFGTTNETLSPKRLTNRATASMLFMNFDKYLQR